MTVATLRPNGTIAGTPTGAATVHAALSDNSDASYAIGVSTGSKAAEVQLETVAMSGGITKALRARARAMYSYAPGLPMLAGIRAGNVGAPYDTGVVTEVLFVLGAATPSTYDGPFTPVSLSQAQVDGLTMFSAQQVYYVPHYGSQFFEYYADLIWVAKPVVVVTPVAPDPVTATNVVPIAWTNTLDADGGAQTRYDVKVFSAAQYGAGGFNPDTSPTTYDTGDTLSSTSGVSVGPLDDGTYRAYVAVAQTVNGVSHWSAWAYDQFAVDVPTADVLAVTATPDDTLGRIQIDVSRVLASGAWEFIEVERSTDAGVTWSPVRYANYVDATASADTFQVFDYEVANTTDVIYRARATRFVTGLQATGAWVQTAAVSWTSSLCWLKSPTNPALNMTIQLKTMPQFRRSRTVGVYPIVGAVFPVVVSDVLGARTGSLDILVDLAAPSPERLLEEPSLIFQPPPAWHLPSLHFAPGSVEQARGAKTIEPQVRWVVDVIETEPPADETAGQ